MISLGSKVVYTEGAMFRLLAGAPITAGQIVGYTISSGSDTIVPSKYTENRQSAILGVAVEDVVNFGEPVTVASIGSICKVQTSSTISAGEWVMCSGTAGMADIYDDSITFMGESLLGLAVTSSDASGYLYVLITLGIGGG